MKNVYLAATFIFAVLFFQSTGLFAQWQSDVRLTNNPANKYTSENNSWCVASSGSAVHVVWQDARDGYFELYYKRSTDSGVSWGADTRLTNALYNSANPCISVSGNVVHVVWNDDRSLVNFKIYHKRSTDGGITWSSDTQLSNTQNPSSEKPSVAVNGQFIHVAWHDNRNGALGEIYYKRSTNGGVSWGADTRLSNFDSLYSQFPCIAASGPDIHVVWCDQRNSDYEIYYKRSTDGGSSWGADTRLTNSANFSVYPSLAVMGQTLHVTWNDIRDGNYEIYHKRSTNGGVNWDADERLTNNAGLSQFSSVAVSGSAVHVVWQDARDGNNWEIFYKRDPTGNPTGITNIGSEVPNGFSLFQNYPNPFNPATNIRFSIPKAGQVKLAIYDAAGREISVPLNGSLSAGVYELSFGAADLSSGIYFYKLETEGFTRVKKMILIK